MPVATGFFQMKDSAVVPDALAENLFNAAGGQSFLHPNLQGIVANDASFVTNEFLDNGNIRGTMFKVDDLPDGFSAVVLKARWKFVNCTQAFARTSNFEISLHQGNIVHSPLVELDLSGQIASLGFSCDVWNDLELSVSSALITDRKDLYIRVYMDRVTGGSFTNQRVSWLVLESSFPFGSAETPAFKSYVNDLTKILNISARQEGTTGSTRYCYRVVPCDASGVCGPSSDEVVVTDGNATLDATNHICISWLDDVGATNYKVYRTCGPSNLGIGLLDTVIPGQGDCGGGGGGGQTGYKDNGSACITDCDDKFDLDALEGCQGVTTVTYPAKETPA